MTLQLPAKIPERYVELARKIRDLATEAGLYELTVRMRPGFKGDWNEDINMTWTSGRHEADVKKFQLQSTLWHREEHGQEGEEAATRR